MFRILFFLTMFLLPCFSLQLDRVILSSDKKPFYLEFWPVVAPIWKRMGLQPTLALIADEDCFVDTSLGDVIRFVPMQDVPISLQAQAIRLLLPVLFPNEGCLISDIDMIPIGWEYFFEGAFFCPGSSFLVYREVTSEYYRYHYPMCYIAGKGSVFSEVFKVKSKEEFPEVLRSWASKGYGWNTDERVLHEALDAWGQKGGDVVRLGHGVFGRIDRANWNLDFDSLDLSLYIDCHCPRPYSSYKKSIDKIVDQLSLKLILNGP